MATQQSFAVNKILESRKLIFSQKGNKGFSQNLKRSEGVWVGKGGERERSLFKFKGKCSLKRKSNLLFENWNQFPHLINKFVY